MINIKSNIIFLLSFLLLFSNVSATTSSPIAYSAVLAIVIVELIFAFSVGIACIFFSFNLFRALKETSNDQISSMPEGYLPPRPLARNISSDSFYSSSSVVINPLQSSNPSINPINTHVASNASMQNRYFSQDDELMDEETQLPNSPHPPAQSIFQTFYSYIKVW